MCSSCPSRFTCAFLRKVAQSGAGHRCRSCWWIVERGERRAEKRWRRLNSYRQHHQHIRVRIKTAGDHCCCSVLLILTPLHLRTLPPFFPLNGEFQLLNLQLRKLGQIWRHCSLRVLVSMCMCLCQCVACARALRQLGWICGSPREFEKAKGGLLSVPLLL